LIDYPGASAYATARHIIETSHPDYDATALEKAIGRWRKLPHWRQHYPHGK
jgi:hypothetical protein